MRIAESSVAESSVLNKNKLFSLCITRSISDHQSVTERYARAFNCPLFSTSNEYKEMYF